MGASEVTGAELGSREGDLGGERGEGRGERGEERRWKGSIGRGLTKKVERQHARERHQVHLRQTGVEVGTLRAGEPRMLSS